MNPFSLAWLDKEILSTTNKTFFCPYLKVLHTLINDHQIKHQTSEKMHQKTGEYAFRSQINPGENIAGDERIRHLKRRLPDVHQHVDKRMN